MGVLPVAPGNKKHGGMRANTTPYACACARRRGDADACQHKFHIPLKLPLDSARRAPGTERGYSYALLRTTNEVMTTE